MSRQLSVTGFLKKPSSGGLERGEKRGSDVLEDNEEGGPAVTAVLSAAPGAKATSSGKEVRREYRVQWEREFTWLRAEGGKMFCDICRRAKANNGFVKGCTTIQKSALNDHKSSHSHIESCAVVNQSVQMEKHVEKSQVACNEALKTQLKVVLHMANTSTPSHQYPKLIHLLQSAGCPNLNTAHTYTHHDTVYQMEEAIAATITSAIDDRIASSRYVGVIVDETTNITVEKMLITYLSLQQNGEPETVFMGNYAIPSGTAECIAAKIKDVLSGRGVAMSRVVGLGSDGANVMVGRKNGVAQQLRQNDCPYLVNIHCGAHRTALAARDASKAVREIDAYVTTVNNTYTYYKNSPIRTHRLKELQKEMDEHDLLSLKQPSATRWLSLERAVKGMRANWVALVLELEEEEAARDCPVAKGLRRQLQKSTFPALTHLLTDVLSVVNRMNLTFQKEDVNISSIQPVVNMTLASLDDLISEPGVAERKFNEASQDGRFCGITLTQPDAQAFSKLRSQYLAEITKSVKKRFPEEHLGIIADLDTVLNASRYPTADSALKTHGLEALERVCDQYGSPRGAAAPLVENDRMQRDFLPMKRVLAGSGNPSFRGSCRLLITSLGEMFPDFRALAEVALVIPVSSVAAERGFSLQNKIKTATRSRLSEAKAQHLMSIASAAESIDTFDYTQASALFKSMRPRRKV
ncbi:hypothetical protein PBY51_008456 [Eleginops maclovinus]|uniref:Zinc finger protein 862 n=1 Tax=Eleginops maclovinus TaxID=56733 RepID=A0AAN7WG63_ELEMC|nr:hypothetical protein PBY51_008456 [Eleginops maclovinus]